MKKLLSVLSLIVISALLFAGCANTAVNTESKGEGLPKFIVGFDAEYPPFGYLSEDGKEYIGFDLDLAKEVCKRTGMEYVPQPIDWDSKDLELNSGSIDCIWSGFTIDGREDDYEWSIPYVDNSIVMVVRKDSGINKLTDLIGKNVMVQAASSGLAALESEDNTPLTSSFKKLEQCADYNSAFMNLESGVVDAVAVDIGVAKFQLGNKDIFKMLDESVSSEKYGIGFKLGNTELREKVEGALAEMWKDGTVKTIVKKYVDYSLEDTLCLGDYVE